MERFSRRRELWRKLWATEDRPGAEEEHAAALGAWNDYIDTYEHENGAGTGYTMARQQEAYEEGRIDEARDAEPVRLWLRLLVLSERLARLRGMSSAPLADIAAVEKAHRTAIARAAEIGLDGHALQADALESALAENEAIA